jgi:hypothetical protein
VSDAKADKMAELLADTVPMPSPEQAAAEAAEAGGVKHLRELGLRTVGEAGWLDANNEAPPLRVLLTVQGDDGREVAFMPAGKVAMIAAPGGTGKSQALVQLAVALASGTRWLETYRPPQAGAVLLALGEEDGEEMHRRIRKAVRAMGWPETADGVARNLHALSLCGKHASFIDEAGEETDFYKDFHAGLKAWGVEWSLIILDPASRFLGPDAEKDNAQATRFIECLERLTELPGRPTVLFAHHTNKEGLAGNTDQGAARGSSGLTDGARWQANLDRCHEEPTKADREAKRKGKLIPDEVILRMVKANHCGIAAPRHLKKRDGGFLSPLNEAENTERNRKAGEARRLAPAAPRVDGRSRASGGEDDDR